jgi:Bifunctional DNA primase/polymerase, N-terminal
MAKHHQAPLQTTPYIKNLKSNFTSNLIIDKARHESRLMEEISIYCERGWLIHPLNNKKRPLLTDWQNKATTIPKVFMKWINEWPWANVGIVTGSVSNLLILDVDGLEGVNSLQGLNLPESPTVVTARGHHYYFEFPEELYNIPTTRAGLLPGIDTRGRGGYITAPPSLHENGHLYYWSKPLMGGLPKPPDWLIKLLTPQVKTFCKMPMLTLGKKGSPYSFTALKKESEAVATAAVGTRNSRLNQAAFSMGTLVAAGAISIELVADHLASAAMSAGLECNEIEKTLQSGLSAGMKHPREVSHG